LTGQDQARKPKTALRLSLPKPQPFHARALCKEPKQPPNFYVPVSSKERRSPSTPPHLTFWLKTIRLVAAGDFPALSRAFCLRICKGHLGGGSDRIEVGHIKCSAAETRPFHDEVRRLFQAWFLPLELTSRALEATILSRLTGIPDNDVLEQVRVAHPPLSRRRGPTGPVVSACVCATAAELALLSCLVLPYRASLPLAENLGSSRYTSGARCAFRFPLAPLHKTPIRQASPAGATQRSRRGGEEGWTRLCTRLQSTGKQKV